MHKRNYLKILYILSLSLIVSVPLSNKAEMKVYASETQDDNVPTELSISRSDDTVYAKWTNEKDPKAHYLKVFQKTDSGYTEKSGLISINKGRTKYDITKYVKYEGTYYFELTVRDTGLSVFSSDYTISKDTAKEIRKAYNSTRIATVDSTGKTITGAKIHVTPFTATEDDMKEITKAEAERTKGPGIITPACTWTKTESGWQYFKENGQKATDEWKYIHKIWYRFDENGVILRNTWVKETDGYYYYLNERGALITDGKTPDGKTVDKYGRWIGV